MDQSPPGTENTPAEPVPVPPPEPRQRNHPRKGGWNFGRLLAGLIVVLIGLAMLSNSMGWDWFQNVAWWRFWPVIIIVTGLSMLSGGRSTGRWIGLAAGLLVLAFVGLAIFGVSWTTSRDSGSFVRDLSIDRFDAATSAVVEFDLGAAELTVQGGSDKLLSGRFSSGGMFLNDASVLNGTIQRVTLQSTHPRNWLNWGKSNLDLRLNDEVPTELRLQGGAFSANLDVASVPVSKVDVDAGASTLTLTLGDKVDLATVEVDAGASTINLSLPKTVGARLQVDSGLTRKTLPEFTQTADGRYQTANYDSAAKKVELNFDLGASTLNVFWR